MRLLVGLGNPGPGHALNRHNVGFMAVDQVVRRHGFGAFRRRFRGDLAEGTLGGEKVLVLKPMTYMNRSGAAVRAAMDYYRIPPPHVIVVHDELDLIPGKVRVKRGGGHGGHNGLRDLVRHIGPDFVRVRVGIGHPGDKRLVEHYVLHDFAKDERTLMERVISAVAEAIPLLVADDADRFMSKVALLVRGSDAETPASRDRGAVDGTGDGV